MCVREKWQGEREENRDHKITRFASDADAVAVAMCLLSLSTQAHLHLARDTIFSRFSMYPRKEEVEDERSGKCVVMRGPAKKSKKEERKESQKVKLSS